jgi:aspartate-semialdehyde dehydrogenase
MAAASGRSVKLAVVGAPGTVGSQIVELIGARDFSYAELKLFATNAGIAAEVESGDRALPVAQLESAADLASFDVAFLALPEGEAARIAAARPGPILIDLSAALRAPASIPIVAPGLTPRERLLELESGKIFAVPYPAAQVVASILNAIGFHTGVAAAHVMIAASAGGREAVSKLFNQSVDLLNARLDLGDEDTQLAFNVFLPPDGRELAAAIAAQVPALMRDAPQVLVRVTQIPAFHGGALALFVPSAGDIDEWAGRLRSAPGIILVDTDEASGLTDAVGQEGVVVRMGGGGTGGVTLWCTYDGARIAALSALWVAETLASVTA